MLSFELGEYCGTQATLTKSINFGIVISSKALISLQSKFVRKSF